MPTDADRGRGPARPGDVHPAVKLWRMAVFLDGEEGMNADAWFARMTQSDPGRRYFDRTYPGPADRNDKLWADCSPDAKRFHARQEFILDTGMSREEAAPQEQGAAPSVPVAQRNSRATIPPDAYFMADHECFYRISDDGSLGSMFFWAWRDRRAEFPQSRQEGLDRTTPPAAPGAAAATLDEMAGRLRSDLKRWHGLDMSLAMAADLLAFTVTGLPGGPDRDAALAQWAAPASALPGSEAVAPTPWTVFGLSRDSRNGVLLHDADGRQLGVIWNNDGKPGAAIADLIVASINARLAATKTDGAALPVTVSDGAALWKAVDIVAQMAGEHQTGTAVQGLLRGAQRLRHHALLAETIQRTEAGAAKDAPAGPGLAGAVPADKVRAYLDAQDAWDRHDDPPDPDDPAQAEAAAAHRAEGVELRQTLGLARNDLDAALDGGAGGGFQARNAAWMAEVFAGDPTDLAERIHRHWEEDAELGQSLGGTLAQWNAIGAYVFGRPIGDPAQEVGGTLTTLALLCEFAGIDMAAAGEAELARCSTPEIRAKIREKRSKRHGRGPLPGTYAPDFDSAARAAGAEP